MRLSRLFTGFVLAVLVAPSLAAQQADLTDMKEWLVPWEDSRPRDPYVAPDGKVWFVGQTADYVAYLEPETGEFKKFDLEDGAGPHNLVVGKDGAVWYTGNRATHLGRVDPESGEIEKFMMPDEAARDPHTLTFDAEGDMWFTVQGGNFVGKFWKPTGDDWYRCSGPEEFLNFEHPDYAKAAWNLHIDAKAQGWCRLSTETRVLGTDSTAKRKFRAYWSVVYPGSAYIRRVLLKAIKRRAERS